MIRLEQTEATGLGYRHRTWTRVGEGRRRVSALQNQFALSEVGLSEEEAVKLFRVWLWKEMQDNFNVVWREMSELANAHEEGKEVEILVPKDAPHGDVIVRALLWMVENSEEVKLPEIRGSEPGPCHEPILPDGMLATRAEIDPKHIVWITGRTQSRIGVICAYGQAFVPEYGVLPLKNFRWVNRKLARSPGMQRLLNDALDDAFEAEADATPVEYEAEPGWTPEEHFDNQADWFWEQTEEEHMVGDAALAEAERDTLTLAEQLSEEIGDWDAVMTVAQTPDVEEWYRKRPPLPGNVLAETMRPAYKHRGDDSPLMVRSVEDQLEGKGWRYATKEEAAAYAQTFRSTKP